jgi:hypothetical protein
LQKKIAIFLGFFFMVKPIKAYHAKISEKLELGLDPRFWLVTNLKNKN